MANTQLKFYYKNVMAEVIGEEHGITKEQFKALAEQTTPLIPKMKAEITGGATRYGSLPTNAAMAEEIKALAGKLKDKCENLVILGIGGSALGNIAVQTALNPYMYNIDKKQRKGPRLFVFDNVDPVQFASFLDWLGNRLDKTIFNVISKSGRTSETAAQFMIIQDMLLEKNQRRHLSDHVVITTSFETDEQGKHISTLYTIAKAAKHEIRLLEIPDNVGGRFSVLSPAGLFSAAMCGIDIDSMLAGARDMDERINCEDFYKNPAAINAAINYHYYTSGKKMSVMMPYSYHLKDFADWYRQLWAESLGKKFDLQNKHEIYVGPTPIKALGVTDQHSQVQLYREGPNDKLFTFLEVKNFDRDIKIGPAPECTQELGFLAGKKMSELLKSEKLATEYALKESKRPCMTVLFDKIDAYSVGQFIYLFEATTSFAGALFNIDTYRQPAVELVKEATLALMGKEGYEDLAQEILPVGEIDREYLA